MNNLLFSNIKPLWESWHSLANKVCSNKLLTTKAQWTLGFHWSDPPNKRRAYCLHHSCWAAGIFFRNLLATPITQSPLPFTSLFVIRLHSWIFYHSLLIDFLILTQECVLYIYVVRNQWIYTENSSSFCSLTRYFSQTNKT